MHAYEFEVPVRYWSYRWATIASYLPERTDNDVKNFWNTHLKKKLKKIQTLDREGGAGTAASSTSQPALSKGQWERRVQADIHMARRALDEALALQDKPTVSPTMTATATYASSAENISRLLQGWLKNNSSSAKTTVSNYSSTSTDASSSTTVAASKSDLSPVMDSSLFKLDSPSLEGSETQADIKIPILTSLFETWLFEEESMELDRFDLIL